MTLGGSHCDLRLFKLGRLLHTGFEPRSLAWLACSTGQSATTYTTMAELELKMSWLNKRYSMEWWWIGVQWNGSLMGGEILRRGWGVVMSWWGGGAGEWRCYAGWGVLTRMGAVVWQISCGDHSLLFICGSGSWTWFQGRRWGLLARCALEMYSEAPIVVTFP